MDTKDKIARGGCIQSMLRTEGWKYVRDYIQQQMVQLNNLKSLEDVNTNELVIQVRKRTTKIKVYQEILNILDFWVKEGTQAFHKEQKNG